MTKHCNTVRSKLSPTLIAIDLLTIRIITIVTLKIIITISIFQCSKCCLLWTQRILADCSTHRLVRIVIGWRDGQSWSRFEAGRRSMHSTSVPMRFTSGRSWASQFRMQKSPGQVGEAPRPQWLSRTMLCFSRNPVTKDLQRNLPLLAKMKNMPAFAANTSLRPSQSKPWARWTSQLANSLPIWKKISSVSGDERGGVFLFERVSVLVQRYNAVFLHDTLPTPDCTDWWYIPDFEFS